MIGTMMQKCWNGTSKLTIFKYWPQRRDHCKKTYWSLIILFYRQTTSADLDKLGAADFATIQELFDFLNGGFLQEGDWRPSCDLKPSVLKYKTI